MTILLSIFEQLFILLVPELVVWFEGGGAFNSPNKPDFVKKVLSIKSKFVFGMSFPLIIDPLT
jgi:hypothetical protein